MRYIKFNTLEKAKAYEPVLQVVHDNLFAADPSQPRIIDAVFPTWDGMFALTLHLDTPPPDYGDGELVDSVEPPPPVGE